MVSKRVIPVLLLKNNGLVKTVKFKDPTYLGDPINIVKIFNEKEVDEIAIFDIEASLHKKGPDFAKIGDIVSEAFMPLSYGGGINKLSDIEQLLQIGIEKVALTTSAFEHPEFVSAAVGIAGSSTIIGGMDVKKNLWGNYSVYVKCGTQNTKVSPLDYAVQLEDMGVGEIFINNISLDGTMLGYDKKLISDISSRVKVPIICAGGAGSKEDIIEILKLNEVSAAAAGSIFVFQETQGGPYYLPLLRRYSI